MSVRALAVGYPALACHDKASQSEHGRHAPTRLVHSAAAAIWNLTREPAVVIDHGGTILAANGAYCRLVERGAADVIGRVCDLHLQDSDELRSGAERSAVLLSVEGTRIPVRVRAIRADDDNDDGAEVSWVVLLEDLRECSMSDAMIVPRVAEQSLRAEAEKRRADDLELARQELAATNARLRETQSELLRASRLAGIAEVASSVLHDVGNVLNSVVVSTALIREDLEVLDGVSDRLYRRCDRLQERVDHLRNIVARQQESARQVAVHELVSVRSIVDEATCIVAEQIEKHGIALTINNDVSSPLELDRHRIVRIIANLLSNACDAVLAVERTDRAISVHSSLSEEELQIRVCDNGKGIPSDQQVSIFSYGFSTKTDGHGFGLHGAANSVRDLGGTLEVHSDGDGRGATFTLRIPATRRTIAS